MKNIQLVVVRRDQFATFGLLAEAFSSEPNVRLVWDRRVRERRHAAQSVAPVDRRGRDRRYSPSTIWGCSDYLLVNVAGSVVLEAAKAQAIPLSPAADRPLSADIRRDIEAAVRSDLTVLISGSDVMHRKSLAHEIHQSSDRSDRRLVVINRGAFIAPGRELSDAARTEWMSAGTVLIEEVADLSQEQQSQLSLILDGRHLQGSDHRRDGSREARIISETGHQLFDRVASKQFRADLFYRLNLIHLVLPTA